MRQYWLTEIKSKRLNTPPHPAVWETTFYWRSCFVKLYPGKGHFWPAKYHLQTWYKHDSHPYHVMLEESWEGGYE